MSSKNLAISVRNLTKEYRIVHQADRPTTLGEAMTQRIKAPLRRPSVEQFRALDDVSFDLEQGKVLGVVGRNGAGKSTLLKVLSRITEPTQGEIRMWGRIASLLEVGTGFHPELTGRENIYLNGAILGMRRQEIDRQFDAIVDFSEVERFLDTPVKRYSSGMYVRLAFAVAAHLNPEILIVDEVLAVGDAAFQAKCLGKMGEVAREGGRTVLFVSHNLAAVRALCTVVAFMANGALVEYGEATKVLATYARATALPPTTELLAPGQSGVLAVEFRHCRDEPTIPRAIFAEPLHILVRMCVADSDKLLNVNVVLRAQDGTTVGTFCGPEEGLTFKALPGTAILELATDRLDLLPGAYTAELILFSPHEFARPYYRDERAFTLEVEKKVLPGGVDSYDTAHGYVRFAQASALTSTVKAQGLN